VPQFAYRARNAQGNLVEGVLDCPDRAVAMFTMSRPPNLTRDFAVRSVRLPISVTASQGDAENAQ
jgi:hypothetical protein